VSISIQHCVEDQFLNLFRADLAASTKTVELLSPFVSLNRSSDYYAVFTALSVRSIAVRAYVRPRQEQPESLRPGFPEAIRNLESRGVQILQRPGMHEKVAAVDGAILWHGSLNILSHNSSRESMLRFESSDLVQEVLGDLGIARDPKPDEAKVELFLTGPQCPVCSGAMRLFEDAGMWVCNDSPGCPGVMSIGSADTEIAAEAEILDMNCPICNSAMVVRGALRRQICCTRVTCGFSLEPRLSAGILRILARRLAQ